MNFPDNEEIAVKNNFEDENNSVNFPKIKDDIEEVEMQKRVLGPSN